MTLRIMFLYSKDDVKDIASLLKIIIKEIIESIPRGSKLRKVLIEKESIRLPFKSGRRTHSIKVRIPKWNLDLVAVLSGLPVFWKAVPAIDRSVRVWFERNLSLSAAVRTGCVVHFPRGSTKTSPVVVSSPEGVSVIKSHFLFTSAFSG
jgi:hypothetical protein